MKRDEESGLSYHTARHYLPWLGRWECCDPSGTRCGLNLYCYCVCNPANSIDKTGKRPITSSELNHVNRLLDIEMQAESSIAKLSPLAQIVSYLFGSLPRTASLAKAERISYSNAIASAKEGEGIVPYVNDIGQTQYLTQSAYQKAQAAERAFRTGENIAGGVGGAIRYFAGGDKGSDVGAVADAGLLMLTPHPSNSQPVVGLPYSSRYQGSAPTYQTRPKQPPLATPTVKPEPKLFQAGTVKPEQKLLQAGTVAPQPNLTEPSKGVSRFPLNPFELFPKVGLPQFYGQVSRRH